jgi:hypothetical protein
MCLHGVIVRCRGMGHGGKILGARAPVTTLLSFVALMWALCWVGAASSSRDMDSDLVETETGWQFDGEDGIDTFANSTAPAPAPAAQSGVIPLIDGDFELTNITGNATVNADPTSTAIVNWTPGGAGVQILQSATYGTRTSTVKSVFCIHLNTPTATNGTQGSLSTTLATAPASGKSYTVQYDVCRSPDGPSNLWPALRVSALQGSTVSDWVIHNPVYNVTDTLGHSTWTRQSFVYHGTGAATAIKFESMSEKYGCIIDNVQILSGVHQLAGAPLDALSGLCQRLLPAISLLALALSHIL